MVKCAVWSFSFGGSALLLLRTLAWDTSKCLTVPSTLLLKWLQSASSLEFQPILWTHKEGACIRVHRQKACSPVFLSVWHRLFALKANLTDILLLYHTWRKPCVHFYLDWLRRWMVLLPCGRADMDHLPSPRVVFAAVWFSTKVIQNFLSLNQKKEK